jgi:hypothetical protein
MLVPKLNKRIQNNKQNKTKIIPLILASAATLSTANPAQAVQFNFTYAPNTTIEQMVGFEMAGKIWSNYLTDDVTVNIHVEMVNDLPENVIGGALTGWQANEKYEDFVDSIYDDRTSTDDYTAVSNLAMKKDGKKFNTLVDGRQIKDLEKINITNANAKALGMLSADNSDLDGYIVFNSLVGKSTTWNYNFTNSAVSQGQLDFLSVATHEIGHILGFASGLDDPGWLNAINTFYDTGKFDKKTSNYFSPLDQFRYSSKSANTFNEADGQLGLSDLSIGGTKYFSIDRGKTALAQMSTGENTGMGGDGEQASHWKQQNNSVGIMSPLLNTGVRSNITAIDARAFDVIGWDASNVGADISQQQLNSFYADSLNFVNSNASTLRGDRESEVQEMIADSEIYKWGTGGSGGIAVCIPTPTRPCNRVWQKAMWQKMDSAATPEASTAAALLAFGLLGVTVYRQRY